MPNVVRIDKIFKDVKGKVLKKAYIPKSIAMKYLVENIDEVNKIKITSKK